MVGAGPAGLAAVAEILHSKPSINLAWIDPDFMGGRLHNYPSVPSNTKVRLFRRYREFVERVIQTDQEDWFGGVDGEEHCELRLAAIMVQRLNAAMIESGKVAIYKDTCITIISELDVIMIKTKANKTITAKAIILATGCEPRLEPTDSNDKNIIDLDTALNQGTLRSIITPNDKVLVFGNSHSAALVLRNLHSLNVQCKCIYKRPPLYALYQPDSEQIIYDNTGLKGVAAEWMKQHWDTLDKCLLSEYEDEDYKEWRVVKAIGFTKCETVRIKTDGKEFRVNDLCRHNGTPQLQCKQDKHIIPRLFGIGIAFPGTDKYTFENNEIVEESVGLFKFCRHAVLDVPKILKFL